MGDFVGMECEDKKYNILENILQAINRKYVAPPEEETKRNNKLLQVIDRIIQNMRSKSTLFDKLYQNKFYGGSYYDGLKVGKPNEYDLDCLLSLPKIIEPVVVNSDKAGYVHIEVNMKALEKNPVESIKYVELNKFCVGNRLSTMKVRSWLESLMASALKSHTKMEVEIDGTKYPVKAKVSKSGPAHTIMLNGQLKGTTFDLDIDLVPCFTFFEDNWPKGDYRQNPSKTKKTFFVVPKSPSENHTLYWRLSFQEQERELISGCSVMKPAIKLIKKIRDRHRHKIASYYIKTVFLWESEKLDKTFWCSNSLSFVFAVMLRKYAEYIERKSIPYFWNKENNLIGDLSDVTTFNVCNKIRNIADHIDKICTTKLDIYGIVPYLVTPDEVEIDSFKKEVPLSKKLGKQNAAKISSNGCSSATCSSTKLLERLELMTVSLVLGQKRIEGMLETALDRIESCENQINHLAKIVEMEKLKDVDKLGTETEREYC